MRKTCTMEYKMFIFVLVKILASILVRPAHSTICCVPDQLEATLIYDLGQCFIDTETAYSFTNATVGMAYDYTNKRIYLNITAMEVSPLIPKPVTERTTMIYDYGKGVQYTFQGKSCSKESLTSPMTQRCIPDNAILMSNFSMGSKDFQVSVYSFTSTGDLQAKVRATIDTTTCIPVTQEWILGSSESDSGTLNQVQVMDVSKGIKDNSIFTPPKNCLNEGSDVGHPKKSRLSQKLVSHLSNTLFL